LDCFGDAWVEMAGTASGWAIVRDTFQDSAMGTGAQTLLRVPA
jgi:hypothetical protein